MKKNTYYYQLFGHRVCSQLALPEAAPWPGGTAAEADINILLEPVPAKILQAINEPGASWLGIIDETSHWFSCCGGHYYVTNGNSIVVDQQVAEDIIDTRIFLLGTGMGLLLIQRGLLPIHGSSVIRDGHVVIVGGDSGAGKSTVTEALLRLKGVRYLADDVSVLDIREDGIFVLPAYPQRKLCRNAALEMGYTLSELLPIGKERDKFALRSTEDWCQNPAPLGAIIEIRPQDDAESVSIKQMQGHASLGFIFRNLYRSYVHFSHGMRPNTLKKCLSVAAAAPLSFLVRPTEGDFINTMVDHIEEFL